ncbi:MAG: Sec-independent protein translocase protein TatB [Gammaproteobacteria bacterium]
MFEVGFWEIVMVGLVALLVIGPERLPKAARIAGFWIGKTRGMITAVKAEIAEELHAEELRQTLKEQADLEEVRQLMDEASESVQDLNDSLGGRPSNVKNRSKPSKKR